MTAKFLLYHFVRCLTITLSVCTPDWPPAFALAPNNMFMTMNSAEVNTNSSNLIIANRRSEGRQAVEEALPLN